jgi:predicted DNA-binding transcriptional regulator AlpA
VTRIEEVRLTDPALAYRVPEAARMIGVSASTMWAIIARAEIPAKKIGGSTVVLRRDLESFVEAAPAARQSSEPRAQRQHEMPGPEKSDEQPAQDARE